MQTREARAGCSMAYKWSSAVGYRLGSHIFDFIESWDYRRRCKGLDCFELPSGLTTSHWDSFVHESRLQVSQVGTSPVWTPFCTSWQSGPAFGLRLPANAYHLYLGMYQSFGSLVCRVQLVYSVCHCWSPQSSSSTGEFRKLVIVLHYVVGEGISHATAVAVVRAERLNQKTREEALT